MIALIKEKIGSDRATRNWNHRARYHKLSPSGRDWLSGVTWCLCLKFDHWQERKVHCFTASVHGACLRLAALSFVLEHMQDSVLVNTSRHDGCCPVVECSKWRFDKECSEVTAQSSAFVNLKIQNQSLTRDWSNSLSDKILTLLCGLPPLVKRGAWEHGKNCTCKVSPKGY